MDSGENIPIPQIALNKEQREMLEAIEYHAILATDENYGIADRLKHFGLAVFRIQPPHSGFPQMKTGIAAVIVITDKGKDVLAYTRAHEKEQLKSRTHDWKIALISGFLGAALLELIKYLLSLLPQLPGAE